MEKQKHEDVAMRLYIEKLRVAGLTGEDDADEPEGASTHHLAEWLRPGYAIGSPIRKKRRLELTANVNATLKRLKGEWKDEAGSTYWVRIVDETGYVMTERSNGTVLPERQLITIESESSIIWRDPYRKLPVIYQLSTGRNKDHVKWTLCAGCNQEVKQKAKQYVWTRVDAGDDK